MLTEPRPEELKRAIKELKETNKRRIENSYWSLERYGENYFVLSTSFENYEQAVDEILIYSKEAVELGFICSEQSHGRNDGLRAATESGSWEFEDPEGYITDELIQKLISEIEKEVNE